MPRFRDEAGRDSTQLARRTQIQPLSMPDFTGGWRPDKSEAEVMPNELIQARNVELNANGNLRKRGGIEKIVDQADLGNGEVEFVFAPRVFTDTGSPAEPEMAQVLMMFNASDGSLYYGNFGEAYKEYDAPGTGTDPTDSGHSPGEVNASDTDYFRAWPLSTLQYGQYVYVTSLRKDGFSGGSGAGGAWETENATANSASLPIRYDADADTFSRPTVHPLNGAATGFPRARSAIVKYNRVFAANVHSEGVFRYPSRVYWSDAGTAETFGTNSWIGVSSDDGDEITSLVPFGEQILIFKNNSVWGLTGTDEDTFSLYQLEGANGCEATYGATAAGGVAYFFSHRDATIYEYDGADLTDIGQPISEWLRRQLNFNATSKVVLQVVNDQLWLSFPNGTFNTGNVTDRNAEILCFDLRHRAWTRWLDWGLVPTIIRRDSDYKTTQAGGAFYPGDENPYFAANGALGAYDGDLLRGWMGTSHDTAGALWSDDGSAVRAEVHTAWLNPGTDRHRMRRATTYHGATSGSTTIDIYKDFITWEEAHTYSYDPAAHTDTVAAFANQEQGMDDFIWTRLKFRLRNDDTERWELNGIDARISTRPHPRGAVMGTQYHDGDEGCGG